MIKPRHLIVFLATAAVLPLASARAQSKPAADANAAAYEIYLAGNYKDASAAYEKVLKDFPTDAIVPTAQIQLAFSYFFQAEFDQALAILAKAASGPPLSPELQQIADGLRPQILSAQAASLPAADAKRKAGFDDAIAKFSEYITKYPQAQDLENAIYGRAIAEYQVGKYDDAVKDLELNLQKFPQSSTIASTKNLLAITLATQGSLELGKGEDKAKAFALYQRAADSLNEIIAKKEDIALINEANFQLGEILFNQAGFSPEADRPALYAQALAAYRAIAPKEEIITLQQDKLKAFPERKRQALQQRNDALRKQLDRDNERELRKLAELQAKPDQVAAALLKMAEIYFQQGQTNEARVLLQHVGPFLTAEDEQKRALYFTTMSYALQNVADQAKSGYDTFQGKYKGDALADNLPFALGNMYLGLNNPAEGIRFFDESLALYPAGRFAGLTVVTKASAETRLGQYADAQQTFQSYLSKNPPPEVGVIAQAGLAGIYKDTQKWDEAIAAYQTVKDKYPGTAQAVEADCWIGICTQQKGDNAGAATLLDAFVKANPKHPLAPVALYASATAQISQNKKEEGLATLAALAEQYPDSSPAPFTYFLRAQMLGGDGKTDEVIALMKHFIATYPKDDKVFPAYNLLAETLINAGKTDEGLAIFREFVEKYADSPQAPEALNKLAELQITKANALGRYPALNEQERATWKTLTDGGIASAEEVLKKYPDSPQVAGALRTLVQAQRSLLTGELTKPAEVEAYFKALAEAAPSPGAKSNILFTLAAFIAEQDKARALALMTEIYQPAVLYSPQDLDFFGLALIDQNKLDEAGQVFEKIAADYAIPAGVNPPQAPYLVQEAQAIALFGRARVAQAKGQTAEAEPLFQQLKTLYPWSPKVLEADYGIAQALQKQGKLDEALPILGNIARASTATADLRANAMRLSGDIMVEKMKAATDPAQKKEFLDAAIDLYIKIATFYGGVPAASSAGLWLGGQLLEQQAAEITDPKLKAAQVEKAKAAYQQLIKDYPNSEFAPKAQERLTALGTTP